MVKFKEMEGVNCLTMDMAAYINWFASGVCQVMPPLCESFKRLPEDAQMDIQLVQVVFILSAQESILKMQGDLLSAQICMLSQLQLIQRQNLLSQVRSRISVPIKKSVLTQTITALVLFNQRLHQIINNMCLDKTDRFKKSTINLMVTAHKWPDDRLVILDIHPRGDMLLRVEILFAFFLVPHLSPLGRL